MAARNYKKAFIHYIEEHVDFMSILWTEDGTTFLDVYGWDGGDIYDNGLEDDESVEFDNPETVDTYIKEIYDSIASEILDVQLPEIIYTEYLKLKN